MNRKNNIPEEARVIIDTVCGAAMADDVLNLSDKKGIQYIPMAVKTLRHACIYIIYHRTNIPAKAIAPIFGMSDEPKYIYQLIPMIENKIKKGDKISVFIDRCEKKLSDLHS